MVTSAITVGGQIKIVQAKLSPTISTTLLSSSITVGDSVYDAATLSGATSDAGGTVTYYYYSDSSCSTGETQVGSSVTVTDGAVPNSADQQFSTAGSFGWKAHYDGDTNNAPADSVCELLTVSIFVAAEGAYHGASISWTTTPGVGGWDLYWSLDPTFLPKTSLVTLSGETLAYAFDTLPSVTGKTGETTVWGSTVYYQVIPSIGGAEQPNLGGSASALAWTTKIEITGTTILASSAGGIRVRINFRSRCLTPITTGVQIGEILTGATTPTPLAVLYTSSINLAGFLSEDYYTVSYTPSEGIPSGEYKVWFFLWNSLPTEGGSWESYAVKTEVPVTVS
jgi:hypothetical protein